jgi:hypothetical protein
MSSCVSLEEATIERNDSYLQPLLPWSKQTLPNCREDVTDLPSASKWLFRAEMYFIVSSRE